MYFTPSSQATQEEWDNQHHAYHTAITIAQSHYYNFAWLWTHETLYTIKSISM